MYKNYNYNLLNNSLYMWANAIQQSVQQTFNTMSSTNVENGEGSNESQCEQCPVCYEDLHIKNVMNLPCNHQMCRGCYYSWTDDKGKNSCPCCRANINMSVPSLTENRRVILDDMNRMQEEVDILTGDCEYYTGLRSTIEEQVDEEQQRLEYVQDQYDQFIDIIEANKHLFPDNSNRMTEFQLYEYFRKQYVTHIIDTIHATKKHLKSLFDQLPSDPSASAILSKVCFRSPKVATDDTIETEIFGTLFDDEPEEEYEDTENIRYGISVESRTGEGGMSMRELRIRGTMLQFDSISEIIDLTQE